MIYTRAYSSSSVGSLVSGRGPQTAPLPGEQLLHKFKRHSRRGNTEPTALVSVSSRIIDTVKRAYEFFNARRDNPKEIWVIFIEVPDSCEVHIHSAKGLAERLGDPESQMFRYEILVEGEISTRWVLHRVSLHTLMSRGLDWTKYFSEGHMTTKAVRLQLVERLDFSNTEMISVYAGRFAQHFGARAPIDWIAHQLYCDCLRPEIIEDDVVALRIYNLKDENERSRNRYVDFEFFEELHTGIDVVLFDLWLEDEDLLAACRELEKWEADQIDNVWRELECLVDDPEVYERAYGILWSRHHRVVEEQSVRIGL